MKCDRQSGEIFIHSIHSNFAKLDSTIKTVFTIETDIEEKLTLVIHFSHFSPRRP